MNSNTDYTYTVLTFDQHDIAAILLTGLDRLQAYRLINNLRRVYPGNRAWMQAEN